MHRRQFLQYTGMAAGAAAFPFNGFSLNTMPRLPLLQALAAAGNPYNRVLVLVQLTGGNDGLSTFIPLDQYSKLAQVRQNVLIPETQVLPLTGVSNSGFHPKMTHMRGLYNDGLLSIVQNVGYPNQDYSHFRSTDIWMSGSDANEYIETGWLGRYLQSEYPTYPNGFPSADMPDPLAVQIGSVISLALMSSAGPMGFAISDATAYYQFINDVVEPAPNTPYGDELSYIRLIAQQAQVYYNSIKDAAGQGQNLSDKYPAAGENFLADQLKIVAQLIDGGLKTPIYIVSLDGFDTHSEQVDTTFGNTEGVHAQLLFQLSEAVGAFQDDLQKLGLDERVAGMTFSEFGRTIAANASNGTDHGAAAPLFVFGKNVIPGVIGDNPNIPADVNLSDDLPMQYDFRSVYASALQDWFGIENTEDLLFDQYDILPIFRAPISGTHSTSAASGIAVRNFPNPFRGFTTIAFTLPQSGRIVIEVLDQQGRLLDTAADRYFESGEHQVAYRNTQLPAGQYVYRLRVGERVVNRQMLVF
jgi:uncharacterized protein (DUF1501 family)